MNLVNHSTRSQCAKILEALRLGYSLTQLDALNLCGCFRLGARIHALKKEGYQIKSEMMEENGKRFAVYSLAKE